MFLKKQPSLIDQEIERLTRELPNQTIGSEEYQTLLDMISKLNEMNKTSQISKDKWLMAGTNILGVLLVINHERVHIVSQAAMSMVQRNKA